MLNLSFQLYSARKFSTLKDRLKLISDLGYTQVEGYDDVYKDVNELSSLLNEFGLSIPSGHFNFKSLEKNENPFRIADKLGIEIIVCPYIENDLRPIDSDGWKYLCDRLMRIKGQCERNSFIFAWHNHDFEFKNLPDGGIPMKILLDYTDIKWEIDLAWVVRGLSEPSQWIKSYSSRLCAAHLKDIAPGDENMDEDGWADVGFGTMNWERYYKILRDLSVPLLIMEHDNPSDLYRFAERSIKKVKSLEIDL